MPKLSRIRPSQASGQGINPVDVAGAVSMLRFDTIKSIHWEIRPSVGIVAKDVDRLGLDIRSFRAPLAAIVRQVMIPSIRTNFAEEGRPKWAQLAESTVKARKGSAHPILRRTGLLATRARQFNIWSIGPTTATIRSFPRDAFYGVYHQGGAARSGSNFGSLHPKSKEAQLILGKFMHKAAKELGPKASPKHIRARAVGMALDQGAWTLPARPFIMYQESDIPKMEEIFYAWMVERARRVGRFTDSA